MLASSPSLSAELSLRRLPFHGGVDCTNGHSRALMPPAHRAINNNAGKTNRKTKANFAIPVWWENFIFFSGFRRKRTALPHSFQMATNEGKSAGLAGACSFTVQWRRLPIEVSKAKPTINLCILIRNIFHNFNKYELNLLT